MTDSMPNFHPHFDFLKVRQLIFPNLLGLNYEHDLVNNFNHMNQSSIKGQLLQLIQSSDPISQEQLQQFIQYINGAQIQSVQDDGHFVQANLILLGKEFHFTQDIHMSFESRKKPDGKIDPRFCRILFYLDLFYLKETVIDKIGRASCRERGIGWSVAECR